MNHSVDVELGQARDNLADLFLLCKDVHVEGRTFALEDQRVGREDGEAWISVFVKVGAKKASDIRYGGRLFTSIGERSLFFTYQVHTSI